MNLESRLIQKFVDVVLSKLVNLAKYDNNPKLANIHLKKSNMIVTISMVVLLLLKFNVFKNNFLNLVVFLILILGTLSILAFKFVIFQKGLLDITEQEKIRYEKQLKNGHTFTLLFFSPILVIAVYAISVLHKHGIL